MYLDAFKLLTSIPPVETSEDEEQFSRKLRNLLDDHSQILGHLARGFKECQSRIKVCGFLLDFDFGQTPVLSFSSPLICLLSLIISLPPLLKLSIIPAFVH